MTCRYFPFFYSYFFLILFFHNPLVGQNQFGRIFKENANFLKQNSCAEIIKDSDLTADLILHGLLGFYNNPDKVDMIKNKLKGLTHKNTSERMLKYIQDSNVTQ